MTTPLQTLTEQLEAGDEDVPVTPQRSALMAKVKGKNTSPEMAVRRAAHSLGFRFRLHRRDLPGRPDVVFPKHKVALFVHGCFWHRHEGCRRTTTPKTRTGFWQGKFSDNQARDERAAAQLTTAGWRVRVIWECETKNREALNARLVKMLQSENAPNEI